MNTWTNYHSHCDYCDGKFPLEEHARVALEKKMIAYGFSSHAPVPFASEWSMKINDLPKYCSEIRNIKNSQKGDTQFYLGLEVDYIPGLVGPKSEIFVKAELDYCVGSVHFVDFFPDGYPWGIDYTSQLFQDGLDQVFGGDIKGAICRYFEITRQMINDETPDVVGHLDKIKMHNVNNSFFSESEKWYRQEIAETLDAIADSGAIVEVNTRGLYKKVSPSLYPSPWVLKLMKEKNIPVIINSDSHTPQEITLLFEEAAKELYNTGYRQLTILLDGKWQQVKFGAEGIQI